MLREPQHERKIIHDTNSPPFVLSTVEGLRKGQQPARANYLAANCEVSKTLIRIYPKVVAPNVLIGGPVGVRLDSR